MALETKKKKFTSSYIEVPLTEIEKRGISRHRQRQKDLQNLSRGKNNVDTVRLSPSHPFSEVRKKIWFDMKTLSKRHVGKTRQTMRAADGGQEDVPTTEVDKGLQAVMGLLCRVILKLIISWTATCQLQVRMGPIVATKMVWKALLFF